jgi:hypothetical protein
LSKQSVERPWVNFEAGAAWTTKKVIPICIKTMSKDHLPKPYSHLTSIDLRYEEDQLFLIRSIAHHLGVDPPEIADRFGGGLGALGGPDMVERVKRQKQMMDDFKKELDVAERVEGAFAKYQEKLISGEMVSLSDLGKPPAEVKE